MYAKSVTICILVASFVVSAHEVVSHDVVSHDVEQPGVVEVHPVSGQQYNGAAAFGRPVNVEGNQLYSMLSPDSPLVHANVNKPHGKPEQYGAPEPAGMPANYKPFGSWGLYVGGNPPDGYYTNFYKSLDGVAANQQPQVQSGVQPASAGVYKQSGPVVFGANQNPYVYSAGELNSAYPVAQGFPTSYSTFDGPEFYATKKVGSPAQQAREISKTSSSSSTSSKVSGTKGASQSQQQQTKGGYAYASPVSQFFQQPQQPQYQSQYQSSQANQVVPYSIPVGSQIVGSQPGVEGAFSPYGIHAFTRYAVKPAFGPSQGQYHHHAQQQHYQPSPFQQYNGYANYYPYGGPSFSSYQFGPVPVAPVAAAPVGPVVGQAAAPVAPVASVAAAPVALENPVVPSSNVAEQQQAPQSPVQIGQAALASPNSPVQQEQQQVEQQQVVEKQAETKSANNQ